MAESYRHAEKKSKGLSLIMGRETIKIPHVVFIFISPKKKCKEGCRSITILKAHHRLDGEPERWLGM